MTSSKNLANFLFWCSTTGQGAGNLPNKPVTDIENAQDSSSNDISAENAGNQGPGEPNHASSGINYTYLCNFHRYIKFWASFMDHDYWIKILSFYIGGGNVATQDASQPAPAGNAKN